MSFLVTGFLLIAAAAAPSKAERVWTDLQGRQITAQFERVDGRNVQLRIDGKITSVPLAQLSDVDRAFLRGESPERTDEPPAASAVPATSARVPRAWLINQKQVIGAVVSGDERGFVLETAERSMRIGYEVISDEADALELIDFLTATGRDDLSETVIAAYERNSGQKLARPGDSPAPPPAEEEVDSVVTPNAEAADKVIGIVPPTLPTPEIVDYQTADEVLNSTAIAAETAPEDLEQFHSTIVWAACVLAGILGAVLLYGWVSMRRSA